MKETREPSNIQRLLREWTLARYTAALENGDLETLSLIMNRATRDEILQLMILEIHEIYQRDDLLPVIDDEDNDSMEMKTGTVNSTPEQPERARRRAVWMRVLAAAVLVVLLGGGFAGIQIWHNLQTKTGGFYTLPTASTKVQNGLCVVNGAAIRPAEMNPQLNTISGDGPDDIWVLGSNNNGQQPLIEHWNGTSWDWDTLPLPPESTPGTTAQFSGIRAFAPDNVWVAGMVDLAPVPVGTGTGSSSGGGPQITPTPTVSNASILPGGNRTTHTPLTALSGGPTNSRALLEHWDGQRWSIVPFINVYPSTWGSSQLNALAAIAPDNIWAVGFFENRAGIPRTSQMLGPLEPLVEHWNGTSWQNILDAAFPQRSIFNTIAASSADNIWISGSFTSAGSGNGGNPGENILLHWNGQHWQHVSVDPNAYVSSISVLAANDVWAIGYGPANNPVGSTPIVEHWNGTAWSVMQTPDATPQQVLNASVSFSSIAAASTRNVWIVGSAWDGRSIYYQVVEHWDGQQWHVLPPDRREDPGQLNGVTSIAGKIWTVGITYDGLQQIQDTLIETTC